MTTSTIRWVRGATAVGLLAAAALTAASAGPAAGHGWDAKAVLRDVNGAKVGVVRFEGDRHGTEVEVVVNGIAVTDTFHGLHVHANDPMGPCDPAPPMPFSNVGPHWNPGGGVHGHHAGDLPSVLIQANGSGTAETVTGRLNLADIVGRAVILHAGPDNFANIPDRYTSTEPPGLPGADNTTKGTGDSGGRIACGIIVRD